MTLKLITQSTLIISLFLLAAACLFSVIVANTPGLSGAPREPDEPSPALVRQISAVPHSVTEERFVNCQDCHVIGARRGMPPNHRTFTKETCSLCHLYPLPSAQAAEIAAQEAAGQPPHTFGWVSPIDSRARDAYDLPDPCAVGANLEQIIMQQGCSVRTDDVACIACHNAEHADAGVRLDDLQGKPNLIGRGYVDRFISPKSAKPDNLKRMFADWQARGYPD